MPSCLLLRTTAETCRGTHLIRCNSHCLPLSEDPELKPVFDEIRSGGMAAMMKVGGLGLRAGPAGTSWRCVCVATGGPLQLLPRACANAPPLLPLRHCST